MSCAAETLDEDKARYQAGGGTITACPPAEPKKRPTLVYPFSGGTVARGKDELGSRERSPVLRLLKLSTQGFKIVGGAGMVRISAQDVAAALGAPAPVAWNNTPDGLEPVMGKLPSEAYYFGLAKYLGDPSAIGITENNATVLAVTLKKQLGWKTRTGSEVYRHVGKLAVSMHIDLQSWCWCPACNGTGLNRKGTCGRCRGSGRRELTHTELAAYIGVTKQAYHKTWVPRVDMIYNELGLWDQALISHLYQQFAAE